MTAAAIELVPAITDPMGRHWQQPKRENVLVDATHACCTRRDFEALLEYSSTIPDGKYVGKMWKRHEPPRWLLCWYSPGEPGFLKINARELIVVDEAEPA